MKKIRTASTTDKCVDEQTDALPQAFEISVNDAILPEMPATGAEEMVPLPPPQAFEISNSPPVPAIAGGDQEKKMQRKIQQLEQR